MRIEEQDDDIVLVSKDHENIKLDISVNDKKVIKNSLEKFKKPVAFGLAELSFAGIIVLLVFVSKVMTHLSKLFKNIHDGDTPFTLENVNHIKKMSYYMIAAIVTSTVAEICFFIAFTIDGTIEFNLFNLVEIIFLYAIAYIFEYGYEIQCDSKGKIYGETEE